MKTEPNFVLQKDRTIVNVDEEIETKKQASENLSIAGAPHIDIDASVRIFF